MVVFIAAEFACSFVILALEHQNSGFCFPRPLSVFMLLIFICSTNKQVTCCFAMNALKTKWIGTDNETNGLRLEYSDEIQICENNYGCYSITYHRLFKCWNDQITQWRRCNIYDILIKWVYFVDWESWRYHRVLEATVIDELERSTWIYLWQYWTWYHSIGKNSYVQKENLEKRNP